MVAKQFKVIKNALKQKKMPTKPAAESPSTRMDAFARGMVWGMHLAKVPREKIQELVTKKNGSAPSLTAIDKIIKHKNDKPEWRGEDSCAGGRPGALTERQKKQLVALVFKARGKALVTSTFCRKQLPFLKRVSRWCVARALHNAGLAWMGRRCKAWVPPQHKESRLEYSDWIERQRQSLLNRFAYTDGCSFYLARGPDEHKDKKRAALGKYVWRMANGSVWIQNGWLI